MNSVFHSPRQNPFQLPPRPQSHYAPSPCKEILDKSVTLTPQKLKHRHEYSLPPEVYTPEQYSFHEEEFASSKPPIPSQRKEDVVLNLENYLNDVDTWDSVKFCEKWPSRVTELKEACGSQESTFSQHPSPGPLSSTARSEIAKPVMKEMKDRPIRVQTSFASERNASSDNDRASNIQKRLDRFRYGAPKAPDERKKENSKLSSPQHVNQSSSSKKSRRLMTRTNVKTPSPKKDNKFTSQRHSRVSVNSDAKSPRPNQPGRKYLPPTPAPDSPDLADSRVSTLNSRLDKLIQESSSIVLSPFSTTKTSDDRSTASILKVSSDATTLSSEFTLSGPIRNDSEPSRQMLWQKEKPSSHEIHRNIAKSRENDILQQWRLKRRMEEAREHAEYNQGVSYEMNLLNKAERPFSVEASKVLQDSTSVYGIQSHPTTPQKHDSSTFPPANHDFRHLPHNLHHGPPVHPHQAPYRCPCMHQQPHVPLHCYSTTQGSSPLKQDVAVGVAELVSTETQTGKSLIFSEDKNHDNDRISSKEEGSSTHGNPIKSTYSNSFPHTSTPASSVSFHRVRIVEAEPENSPQSGKEPLQTQNFTPVSDKTEATTLWSSTDHKRTEENRSPASSVPSSCLRNSSVAESYSPTANIVKQVVGSHLFNTTSTSPTSTSGISRLKSKKNTGGEKKKQVSDGQDNLNGSYTNSNRSDKRCQSPVPQTSEQGCDSPTAESNLPSHLARPGNDRQLEMRPNHDLPETPVITPIKSPVRAKPPTDSYVAENHNESGSESSEEDDESDFDPAEFYDQILEDTKDSQSRLYEGEILLELQREKNQILNDFRQISDEIERSAFEDR